jgi:hypothetical protein
MEVCLIVVATGNANPEFSAGVPLQVVYHMQCTTSNSFVLLNERQLK